MKWQEAKKLMGKNFIGPDELISIAPTLNIAPIEDVPTVPYDAMTLRRASKDYLLILGVAKNSEGKPLTVNNMREFFGFNPETQEPCFYNQDWYVKEKFANAVTLKPRWYLLCKQVRKNTRAVHPDILKKKLKKREKFPAAVLAVFTFFAYYFLNNGDFLWEHDFIWCNDKDRNGDRIYIGRYHDPKKINKSGLNVHRHLSIRSTYGAVTQIS